MTKFRPRQGNKNAGTPFSAKIFEIAFPRAFLSDGRGLVNDYKIFTGFVSLYFFVCRLRGKRMGLEKKTVAHGQEIILQ